MTALDASYYDDVFRDTDSRALRPLHTSPWRDLYLAAARHVPDGAHVVDLGCGTGRFAAALDGRPSSYVGFDFSPVAVEEARRYVPGLDFRVADLRDVDLGACPDAVFTCLEVLEHLDDDLALLRRMPAGSPVVLSVPSFDSAGHVRYFRRGGAAVDRYYADVAIETVERIDLPKYGRFITLITGRAR